MAVEARECACFSNLMLDFVSVGFYESKRARRLAHSQA